MNNNETQQENTMWPPIPSLPPPERVKPKPLLARIPIWMIALIDIGVGIILCGLAYVRLWASRPLIHWDEVAAEGLISALTMFGAHLWVRHVLLKQNPK